MQLISDDDVKILRKESEHTESRTFVFISRKKTGEKTSEFVVKLSNIEG